MLEKNDVFDILGQKVDVYVLFDTSRNHVQICETVSNPNTLEI